MKKKHSTPQATTNGRRLYFTSDNHVFMDEQSAQKHAQHLGNKHISSMSEDAVEAETEALVTREGDVEELYDDM